MCAAGKVEGWRSTVVSFRAAKHLCCGWVPASLEPRLAISKRQSVAAGESVLFKQVQERSEGAHIFGRECRHISQDQQKETEWNM